MANGKLGAASIAADTHTTVYSVPAGTVTTLNITLVNRHPGAANVRVAITDATSPGDADWIEYDAPLPPGGVLERTALVLSAGENVIVHSDVGALSARVHGFEEAA